MSIWYQYKIEAIAPTDTTEAVANFFDLTPKEDVRIDRFSFSFGNKNGPGLRLGKIVAQNPDLIFLVEEQIECDTVSNWLERFDKNTNEHQYVFLYTDGIVTRSINKKVLEEYEKELSGLPEKHIAKKKGFEKFRWNMFFSYNRANRMLANAKEYKETIVLPNSAGDQEREYYDDPKWEENNDFSHLENK